MIKQSASVCIHASTAQVWVYLTRLEDITAWAEPVVRASCDGPIKRGAGAERTCELRGGITIRERWLAWREGEAFTYEGSGLPFVKSARNTWTVRSEGANQTLLATEAVVVLKGGPLGVLMQPMMRLAMRRMGSRSLSAFKYLVEQGRPFAGKHALLPPAPAAC